MSQEYFQCLICNSFFGNLWKVEKHVKHHQNDSVNEESATPTGSCGSRRGMLPIKKVTFPSCFVPVVKNQIDPAFLQQYSEVQAKEEPVEIKQDLEVDTSDFLAMEYDDDLPFKKPPKEVTSPKKRGPKKKLARSWYEYIPITEQDENDELKPNPPENDSLVLENTLRRSRRKAAVNIRRAAAILQIPDQKEVDSEDDKDMDYVQELLDKLSDDDDDDFRPPTHINKNYSTEPRKRGRPFGSTVSKKMTLKEASPSSKITRRRTKNKKQTDKNLEKCQPCEYCSESFLTKSELFIHLYQRHQEDANMITCPVISCGKPYLNFFSLRAHLKLHGDAEHKEISFQEKVNPNPEDQEEDLKPDINCLDAKLPCKFCLEKFPSLKSLQDHFSQDHDDPNLLKCPHCPKDTPENGIIGYLSHMKSYHPETIDPYNERNAAKDVEKYREKIYKCDKCEAAFGFRYKLNVHLKNHDKIVKKKMDADNDPERRFACPVCQKRFKYKDNLRRHFTLHLENNPYVCDFPGCNRKFNSDYNLRRHKALHNQTAVELQRVYCPLCSQSFSRKDKLPRHLREFHNPNELDGATGKKPRRVSRLRHIARLPRFRTYNDIGHLNLEKDASPSTPIPLTNSEPEPPPMKTEAVESSAPEEIHLVDKILLEADGSAVHVKGEHISPQKVGANGSLNLTEEIMEMEDKFKDISSLIMLGQAEQTTTPPNSNTAITKLIKSDPVFQRLSQEDPNKLKDIIRSKYNYLSKGSYFVCEICHADFNRAWTLQLHLKTQHNKTIIEQQQATEENDGDASKITLMCGECAFPVKDEAELALHVERYHPRKRKCPKCGLHFDSQRRLKLHLTEVHGGPRNFQCKFCSKAFTKPYYAKMHERKVHDNSDKPKVKQCPILGCGKILAPSAYYKHVKTHKDANCASAIQAKQEKFKCNLCGDVLCNSMALRRHIDAVHLGKPVNKMQNRKRKDRISGGVRKNGVVRRGFKAPGDEWFLPLLEKAVGFVPRNDSEDEANNEAVVVQPAELNEDQDELMSILGF